MPSLNEETRMSDRKNTPSIPARRRTLFTLAALGAGLSGGLATRIAQAADAPKTLRIGYQ
jgi:sulfonate transport system substrate-binding protein